MPRGQHSTFTRVVTGAHYEPLPLHVWLSAPSVSSGSGQEQRYPSGTLVHEWLQPALSVKHSSISEEKNKRIACVVSLTALGISFDLSQLVILDCRSLLYGYINFKLRQGLDYFIPPEPSKWKRWCEGRNRLYILFHFIICDKLHSFGEPVLLLLNMRIAYHN